MNFIFIHNKSLKKRFFINKNREKYILNQKRKDKSKCDGDEKDF